MTDSPPPALMTKAAYARYRGVGKSAVTNWITREQIVLEGTKVDVAKSDAKLGSVVDPGRGRDPSPKPAVVKTASCGKTTAHPTVADSAQAQLAEERLGEVRERRIGQAMKNAQTAGELVERSEYESRLATYISGFCDRMTSELRGKAEALAKLTENREVRAMLDEAIHTVRTDFAARIEAEVCADGED